MVKWTYQLVVSCVLSGALFVFSSMLFASPYYHISMGLGLSRVGKASNLILTDAITDRYIANRSSKLVMLFSAGAGYRFQLSHTLKLAVGLAGSHMYFGSHDGILHPES